ncbi:hypothetical protein RUM44_006783 [Polyplax serrata]|uniref:CRAL-TRIO domain-containing protein n=1 Tax=Polyplax serrata TaxID=468196 RepID=A0ABR1AKL8_POLSC
MDSNLRVAMPVCDIEKEVEPCEEKVVTKITQREEISSGDEEGQPKSDEDDLTESNDTTKKDGDDCADDATDSADETKRDDLSESIDDTKNGDLNSPKSFLESLDLEVPSSYQVEPIDFPKSPFFSMRNESQVNGNSDEEDKSMFQAQLLSNLEDVHLTKDQGLTVKKKKIIPVGSDIFTDTCCDESSFDGSHTSLDEAEFDAYLDSPDELDDSIMERLGQENVEPLPELSAEEERSDSQCWKSCVIAGVERRIDLKVLEPYKKVITHGGYLSKESHNAIVIFSACFLPDRSRADYDYVMNNLFMYVVSTLDQLVTDDYVLIYLHGATARSCMPKFKWLKLCYEMIDRKLKKNLKGLYLVHPTFWLKTLVLMTKPFISSKFSRKLFFIHSLSELFKAVPLEEVYIPERVKKYDELKFNIPSTE